MGILCGFYSKKHILATTPHLALYLLLAHVCTCLPEHFWHMLSNFSMLFLSFLFEQPYFSVSWPVFASLDLRCWHGGALKSPHHNNACF